MELNERILALDWYLINAHFNIIKIKLSPDKHVENVSS